MIELSGNDADVGYIELSGGAVDETGAALPKPAIVVVQPNRGRRLPIPLNSRGLVAGGATAEAKNDPQVPFRLERLNVPSDIAGFFAISEILIGKDNMLAASGNLPARAFDEEATSMLLGLDTNDPGTTITLNVLNTTLVPFAFNAMAMGIAVVR